MSLNLALIITGDASGARKALAETKAELGGITPEANNAGAAMEMVGKRAATSTALARHEVANLTAQITDFGVQIVSGGSPFLAIIQQGPQAAAAIGDRGLGAAIAGVGQGLLGLINPVTVTLAALTGLGYAASWAFSMVRGEVRSADEVLAEHEENISRLKDVWGEPLDGLRAYARETREVAELLTRVGNIDLKTTLRSQTQEALHQVGAVNRTGRLDNSLFGANQFEAFSSQVAALYREMREGAPDIAKFQKSVLDIAGSNVELQETAAILLRIFADAEKTQRALDANSEALDRIMPSHAAERERDLSAAKAAREGISGNYPTPTERPSDIAIQDDLWENQQKANQKAAKTRDPFAAMMERGRDREAQMRAQLGVVEEFSRQSEAARIAAEMTAEAFKAGEEPTAKQTERIKELAGSLADLAVKLKEVQLNAKLRFEMEQMNRSPIEREVASRLRGTGLGPDSAEAGIIREMDRVERMREAATGFFTAIKDGALSGGDDIGKSIMTSIANAAARQADKLFDEIIGSFVRAIIPGSAPASSGVPAASTIGNVGQMLAGGGRFSASPLADRLPGAPRGSISVPYAVMDGQTFVGGQPVGGRGGMPSIADVSDYIRQAAAARGIDPGTALTVARSEGLGPGIWQSNYNKGGYREPSFGPFQLLKGGPGTGFGRGLGNNFQDATGLDPADPANTYPGIDFALNHAAKNGWGAWYGAAKAGVGRWEGLGGAQAAPVTAGMAEQAKSATKALEDLATGGKAAADASVEAAQGFAGAAGGMGKLAQQMMSVGGGAGGGGWFSSLMGLNGGAGGAINWMNAISPSVTAAIAGGAVGLFADGGWTGPGAKHQAKGIVHADEIVWSKADVARHGGVAVVEAMRQGARGYAEGGVVSAMPFSTPGMAGGGGAGAMGGLHVSVGVSVDKSGNLEAYVTGIAQEKSDAAAKREVKIYSAGSFGRHMQNDAQARQRIPGHAPTWR